MAACNLHSQGLQASFGVNAGPGVMDQKVQVGVGMEGAGCKFKPKVGNGVKAVGRDLAMESQLRDIIHL